MDSELPLLLLARAGKVLVAVGVIDIGVMIYCVANEISYLSSFNIFAVIAGIFLLRGSLRVASIVRWFSVFTLCALGAMLVGWPFLQPVDLTLTQIRLNPGRVVLALGFLALIGVLLYWLAQQLGHASILDARAAAGLKQRSMRVPVFAGVGLVVVLVAGLSLLMGGESASKAVELARPRVGPGYQFHVSSLNIRSGSAGTSVSGVVTAWNSTEVRDIPVSWHDQP